MGRTPSIVKSRISGKDATTIAREALKRRPIPLLATHGVEQPPGALVPSDGLEGKALLAVQIIATGFSGLRLLRQSQRQMTEEFIDVYGNYAIKLLRLQNDMIQTFDRYRRATSRQSRCGTSTYIPGGREWSGS